MGVTSGKHTKNYGKSPFLMGKYGKTHYKLPVNDQKVDFVIARKPFGPKNIWVPRACHIFQGKLIINHGRRLRSVRGSVCLTPLASNGVPYTHALHPQQSYLLRLVILWT